MTYHIVNSCVFVSGSLRSVIYDLQNSDYYFVPAEIEEMLLSEERGPALNAFIQELIRKEVIHPSELQQQDPNADMLDLSSFDYPSTFTNAIIELNAASDIGKIIAIVEAANCYNVQFVLTGIVEDPATYILHLAALIYDSVIKHYELVLPYPLFSGFSRVYDFRKMPELRCLFIYDAPPKAHIINRKSYPSVYFDTNHLSYSRIQNKSIHLFSINTLFFAESLSWNTYYNKKMYISDRGEVKNGPLAGYIPDNINNTSFDLLKIAEDPGFTELWNVKKDMIDVCNVCEFRHMCVDPRIPRRHLGTDHWYHETECNYNPFIAKWQHEPGYHTLEQCGVTAGSPSLHIDDAILKERIKQIYAL